MKQKEKLPQKQETLLRAQLAFYDIVGDLLRLEDSIDLNSPSVDKEIAEFDREWESTISEFCLWMVANRLFLQSLPDWQQAMLVESLKDQTCDAFQSDEDED